MTGTRSELPTDLVGHLRTLRGITTKPICVGFGISTPEQAGLVGRHALLARVGDFIAALKAPLRGS